MLQIPAVDPLSGTLPGGRYLSSFDAIADRFVHHSDFANSINRPVVWDGFRAYRAAWELAEHELGSAVVLAWWVAGSFLSSVENPSDIDVTPVLDGDVLRGLVGSAGMGKVKALIKHRQSIREQFLVEPFPLRWSATKSTLFPDSLTPAEQRMLALRGGLDAWWGRVRPTGPKGPPELPKAWVERGYLEVLA